VFAWASDLDDGTELIKTTADMIQTPRKCEACDPGQCGLEFTHPTAQPQLCDAPPVSPGGSTGGSVGGGSGVGPLPQPCPYTVASGDTLESIGRAKGYSTAIVLAMNPGVNPATLQVGQVVNAPCNCAYDIKSGGFKSSCCEFKSVLGSGGPITTNQLHYANPSSKL
jgi:LysM repeat protein